MRVDFALALVVLVSSGLTAAARAAESPVLSRLLHQNPGLLTDLGVGLWAWPLPMDFDDDGLMDLVVVCPDRPSNGIYFFRNSGEFDPTTRLPVFHPAQRLGDTIQASWGNGPAPAVSFVDGRPVVTTTGAVHREFRTRGFEAPVALVEPARVALVEGRVRDSQWRFADFDGDGRQDLIVGIDFWGDYGWDDAWDAQGRWKNGPLRGQVFVLRNTGTAASPVYAPAEKLKTADGTPVEVFGKPTPNLGDFDGDGDLDLICGEFLDGFTYFQNTGTRTAPRYERGRRLTTAGAPLTLDLCMIVPATCDFDGDGDLDLVVGDEDGRVAFVEHTGKVVDGLPQFLPPRYFRQRADAVKFGALSAPVSVDWDGDGLEDLIAGNTAGYLGFIKNLGGNPLRWAAPVYLSAGNQLARELAGPNGSIQGPAEAKWGYTNPAVADWDGDGLLDILTNGIWGRIIFYRNIGSRTEPRLASGQPVEVAWPGETPKPDWTWWTPRGRELVTQWRTTPAMIDWNQDGLMDLVMLDREGYLAFFERRRSAAGALELLPPQRVFWSEDISAYDGSGRPRNAESGLLRLNDRRAGGSGRRTFTFFDWDRDGQMDILVNATPNVNVLRGLGRDAAGLWRFKDMGPVHPHPLASHSTTPTIARWPAPSGQTLVIGAEDGFFYTLPLGRP
jgi:hypothetical protein